MKSLGQVVVLLSLVGFYRVGQAQQRIWTDAKGKHQTEAELVGFDGSKVMLKRSDGDIIKVAFEKLSAEDRGFVLNNPRTGIGVRVSPLAEVRQDLMEDGIKQPPLGVGLFVRSVVPTGPAAVAGIRRFDIIATVNGQAAKMGCFSHCDPTEKCSLFVYRWTQKPGSSRMTGTWEQHELRTPVLPQEEIKKLEALESPLEIRSDATLGRNTIGTPRITVPVVNRGKEPIAAFKLRIECWNKFGEPVRAFGFGAEGFVGIDQETLPPGEKRKCQWVLHGQEQAKKFKVSILQVKLTDGTEWQPKKGFEVAEMFEFE